MTDRRTELVERIRSALADRPSTREVSMFGGRSFMVDDRMVVSAFQDGGLLVRVDGGRHQELLQRPGAVQAEMGRGRDMGPGWISVSADAIADDDGLAFWLGAALDHHRASAGRRA